MLNAFGRVCSAPSAEVFVLLNPEYGKKSGGCRCRVDRKAHGVARDGSPGGAVGDPALRPGHRHKRGDTVKSRFVAPEVACDVHAGTLGLDVVRLVSSVATTRGHAVALASPRLLATDLLIFVTGRSDHRACGCRCIVNFYWLTGGHAQDLCCVHQN